MDKKNVLIRISVFIALSLFVIYLHSKDEITKLHIRIGNILRCIEVNYSKEALNLDQIEKIFKYPEFQEIAGETIIEKNCGDLIVKSYGFECYFKYENLTDLDNQKNPSEIIFQFDKMEGVCLKTLVDIFGKWEKFEPQKFRPVFSDFTFEREAFRKKKLVIIATRIIRKKKMIDSKCLTLFLKME
jgi:hypothetical protein